MSLSRPAEAWIVSLQSLTTFSIAARDFPGEVATKLIHQVFDLPVVP